jgi:hypothetical protein
VVELLYTEIGDRRYDNVAAALGFTARAIASPVLTVASANLKWSCRDRIARRAFTGPADLQGTTGACG